MLIDYPHTCHLSKITPHTFLSGYKERGRKDENFSLLHKLDKQGRNILVFKDFTSVLSMRREDRAELMSQLREMADGRITSYYGNEQEIILQAHFGVIAACTNAIDEATAVSAALGERFVKYRISAEDAEEIARMASKTVLIKDRLRTEAASMTGQFLKQFDTVFDTPTWDIDCESKLQALCILGAHLRTPIIRDEFGIQVSEVDHEGPGRLITSLNKLAMGIAMAQGRKTVGIVVAPLLKKILQDTVPPYRLLVTRALYYHKVMSTADIARVIRLSWKSAKKYCQEMCSIKIFNETSCISDRGEAKPAWELTQRYVDLIRQSEIFVIDKV
jgi:hypothetical protein